MRLILLTLILINSLFAAKVVEVGEKFQSSKKCKSCHVHIVNEWTESWHAKSHYENDEYFRASIDYVSRKSRKSLNAVKIKCATCHNPRISVTSTNIDYEIAAVMNLQTNSDVDKALHNDSISEGINCVVCHNIDKIHSERSSNARGINRVDWTPSGTMVGPFNDANSPYHKAEYRDFMGENSDQLCFVCHANDRSVKGLVFTNMQKEYQKQGNTGCVDCHMGPKKDGVASTLRTNNGKAKKREIRSHRFEGGHISVFIQDSLGLDLTQEGKDVLISISNNNPHNIPSGFGARELIIDVSYQEGDKEIESRSISLTRHYTSRRGKPTIPHLATKMTKDNSIPANGKRVLKIDANKNATTLEVKIFYRLVNDEVRSILELQDDIWSKKSFVVSNRLRLK